ncbi:protein phosphatase 2C domain-containing protein [Streptacidiphilus melanogenes]|uniref:protein phosphatase 2C domain-containing protein n=1 Tax=Streptacidiphilus melanogenes TaxID=411235 RepID=UPI000A9434ED
MSETMDQLTLSCPNCAQPVAESDRYCEECGIDLSTARASGTDPRATAPAPSGFSATHHATTPDDSPLPSGTSGAAGGTGADGGYDAAPGAAGSRGTAAHDGATGGGLPAAAGKGADGAYGAMPGTGGLGPTGGGLPGAAGEPDAGGGYDAAFGAVGAAAAPVPSGATGDFVLAAPVLATEVEEPEVSGAGAPDPWSSVPAGDARVCVGCGAQRIDTDGYCEACGLAQPRPRDHQERSLNGVCGVSDRGHRHHRNEDAFAVAATSRPDGGSAVVAVVCDGVSSATRPDDASQAAADSASEALLEALESGVEPETAMTEAIMTAANRVDELADEFEREPSRNAPACTIVSAVLTEGRVTVGWVGDSRAYWFPDDRSGSRRLTVDDSWATRMVEAGLMSEAEAFADARAHAITGWLGADAIEVEPHTLTFTPDAPGTVLICTDGLWNYAEAAADLAAVVPADARTKPLHAAQTLARYACDRGGHDNVTVALLPVDGIEPHEPTMPNHPPTLVGDSLDSPTLQLREGES